MRNRFIVLLLLVTLLGMLFSGCSEDSATLEYDRECEYCDSAIQKDVLFCPYCGEEQRKDYAQNTEWNYIHQCKVCGNTTQDDAIYCPFCGEVLNFEESLDGEIYSDNEKNDAKALLGTWVAWNEPWGQFTYSFYADGSCSGSYDGDSSKRQQRVGGVSPSLYPESYYEGCGNGYWFFEDEALIPILVVSYRGDATGDGNGTMQYQYSFNEDKTELTIYGTATHGKQERGSIIWKKVG